MTVNELPFIRYDQSARDVASHVSLIEIDNGIAFLNNLLNNKPKNIYRRMLETLGIYYEMKSNSIEFCEQEALAIRNRLMLAKQKLQHSERY